MNKADGGDFAQISRFFLDLRQITTDPTQGSDVAVSGASGSAADCTQRCYQALPVVAQEEAGSSSPPVD